MEPLISIIVVIVAIAVVVAFFGISSEVTKMRKELTTIREIAEHTTRPPQ